MPPACALARSLRCQRHACSTSVRSARGGAFTGRTMGRSAWPLPRSRTNSRRPCSFTPLASISGRSALRRGHQCPNTASWNANCWINLGVRRPFPSSIRTPSAVRHRRWSSHPDGCNSLVTMKRTRSRSSASNSAISAKSRLPARAKPRMAVWNRLSAGIWSGATTGHTCTGQSTATCGCGNLREGAQRRTRSGDFMASPRRAAAPRHRRSPGGRTSPAPPRGQPHPRTSPDRPPRSATGVGGSSPR